MDVLTIAQRLVGEGHSARDVAIIAPEDVSEQILSENALLSMQNTYILSLIPGVNESRRTIAKKFERMHSDNYAKWRIHIVNCWRLLQAKQVIQREAKITLNILTQNNFHCFQNPDGSFVLAKTYNFDQAQWLAANHGFKKIPSTAKQPAFPDSIAFHIDAKRHNPNILLDLYSFFNEATVNYQLIASYAPQVIYDAFNDFN